MKLIIEFESADEIDEFLRWKKLNDEKKTAIIMKTPIRETDWLDFRTKNTLLSAGIEFVEDALAMSDRKLLTIPNLGNATLRILRGKPKTN